MQNKDLQELIELRDDLERVLDRLGNAMESFRMLQSDISDLKSKNTEEIFAPYIEAGFIPGAYIGVVGKTTNVYKIVAIQDCQYAAVDVNKPDTKITMVLWRDDKCFIDRYILLDEKTAMERASKYTVLENGITEIKRVEK